MPGGASKESGAVVVSGASGVAEKPGALVVVSMIALGALLVCWASFDHLPGS